MALGLAGCASDPPESKAPQPPSAHDETALSAAGDRYLEAVCQSNDSAAALYAQIEGWREGNAFLSDADRGVLRSGQESLDAAAQLLADPPVRWPEQIGWDIDEIIYSLTGAARRMESAAGANTRNEAYDLLSEVSSEDFRIHSPAEEVRRELKLPSLDEEDSGCTDRR